MQARYFLFSYLLRFVGVLILGALSIQLPAQGFIRGSIVDANMEPVIGANIRITETQRGTVSESDGQFVLRHPAGEWTLRITYVGFSPFQRVVRVADGDTLTLDLVMLKDGQMLQQVSVVGRQGTDQAGLYQLDPKEVNLMAAPFPDISRIIASLPGVISNNELSSSYSVRGGNYDENLIYINNIPIFRPQLVKAGRQEGLLLVNPDLTRSIDFSAGGWQSSYGDKLSSNLMATYETRPDTIEASAMLSMMMVSGSVLGTTEDGKFSYSFGARHRNTEYLLNTFEVDGQYLPKYTDFQGMLTWRPGQNTEVSLFSSYLLNRYLVEPATQETDFGTFFSSLRFTVAFDGREELRYNILQNGLNLTHNFSDRFSSQLVLSYVDSRERDYIDVEGGYRLCDIDNNPGSASFNQCATIRGIGTNYHYARNQLDSRILNAEIRNNWDINSLQTIEFGVGYTRNNFDDRLDEYRFIDSARFVSVTEVIKSDNEQTASHLTGYLQHRTELAPGHTLTYGARFNYRDLNGQLLISPRAQYTLAPAAKRDLRIKLAAGLYQQPPFYKEMRDFDGSLVENQLAQTSFHVIAGLDYPFSLWGRPFVWRSEAFYKYMPRVIPYDMDNIRIRYYAREEAKAYAYGLDMRLSGEFIPGTESWFSLGLLNTREDVVNDGRGYINRPTNQNLNVAIVFRDHIPNNPSWRVSLSLFYGSGLPFGPTNDLARRNAFRGEDYKRVDVGFSKYFSLGSGNLLDDLGIGLDILNLLGSNNVISYTWIEDVRGTSFAVPNRLTQRFLNLWVRVNI